MSAKKQKFDPLHDRIIDLKAELSRLTSLQSNVHQEMSDCEYQLLNPLFSTLLSILPRCLIQICQDFLTFDICTKCNKLVPCRLGCLDCKKDDKKTECVMEQTEFSVENVNNNSRLYWYDFSQIVFKDENCREIWTYIEKATSHRLRSMKIGIEAGKHMCALNFKISWICSPFSPYDHYWAITIERVKK